MLTCLYTSLVRYPSASLRHSQYPQSRCPRMQVVEDVHLRSQLLASSHRTHQSPPTQSATPRTNQAEPNRHPALESRRPWPRVDNLKGGRPAKRCCPRCRFPRGTISWSGFLVQMTYSATHPRTNPCLDATTAGHKLVTSTVQVIEDEITAGADGVHTGRREHAGGVYMADCLICVLRLHMQIHTTLRTS